MKFVLGLAALLLGAAPASATIVYSADVPAGQATPFSWHYSGPAPGFEQTFQIKYTDMALDGEWLNSLRYVNIRRTGASESSTDFRTDCFVPVNATSVCEKKADGFGKYPELSFIQTAIPGLITFTIRNPSFYSDPGCTNPNACFSEWGFIEDGELDGQFVGFFAAGGGGHYDFIALDPTAVPEPAVWAFMILGFGLTGFALRQRRGLA